MDLDNNMELLKWEPEVIVKIEPPSTELNCEPEVIVKLEPPLTENSYDATINNDNLIVIKTECESVSFNCGSLNDNIIKEESPLAASEYSQEDTGNLMRSETLTKTRHSCPYCSRNFTTRASFSIHLWKSHSKKNSDVLVEKFDKTYFTCDICNFNSSCSRSLKSHMLMHENVVDAQIFKCNTCDYECSNESLMHVHIKSKHSNERLTYSCTFCNKTLFQKASLADHLLAVHGDKFDKSLKTVISMTIKHCKFCDFRTIIKPKLIHHMRKHGTDTKIFKCNYCDHETCDKSNLKVHIQRKHSNDRPTYSCRFCDKTFCNKVSVRAHTQNMHFNERHTYSCRFCNKPLYRKNSLVDHLLCYHGEKFEKSLKKLLSLDIKHCNLCDFRVHRKSKLIHHIQKEHSNDRPSYTCRFCDKSFSYKDCLADHLLCLHGEQFDKSLKKLLSLDIKHCTLCDFRVHTKRKLIHHIQKEHSNDRSSYTCRFCGKSFSYKDCLADHLLCLHGDKFDKSLKTLLSLTIKYCTLCDFRTIFKLKLHQHMAKHDRSLVKADTDTIIFKCNNCDYETFRKSTLRNHIQSKHSNDRTTYSCRLCEKLFFNKVSLADHLLAQHDLNFDRSLNTLLGHTIKHCKLCDFRTMKKVTLNRHMTKHDRIV